MDTSSPRSCIRLAALAAIVLAAGLAMPARAAEERGILNIQVENDLFVNHGTSDKHYTNGFRVSWLSLENDVPNLVHDFADMVPVFAADGKLRVSYSFGQNMFTPGDITKSEPQPRDRPYAGWLYAGVGLVSDSGGDAGQTLAQRRRRRPVVARRTDPARLSRHDQHDRAPRLG